MVGDVNGVGVAVADVAGAVGEFLSAADLAEAVFKTRLSRDRGFTQFAGEALIVGGSGMCFGHGWHWDDERLANWPGVQEQEKSWLVVVKTD